MYKRILVAVDGTETSLRACSEATNLAVDQKARLRLLHVLSYAYVSSVLGAGASPVDLKQRMREDGEQLLQAAQAAARSAGLEVEPRLLEHQSTQIGEGIIEDAKQWQADLIVMGTHGRRGLARVMMGSDAEYVVRHAPVPLLLIRKP